MTVRRGAATIAISWVTNRAATLSTSTRTYLKDASLKDARRRVHVLRIRAPARSM